MESASSFNASSSKFFRGCCAFGRMRLISISRRSSDSGSGVPRRALSPRPKAFLCAMNNLLCEANVCLSSFGFDVVKQYRPAVARRLTEPNVSRDDGGEDLVAKERFQIMH